MIYFLLWTHQTNEGNDVDDDDGTADDDEDPNHLPLVQPTQASENGFVSWNRTWSGQQRLNGRSHRLMFWHFLVFPMCLVFSFSLENNAILCTRKIMWWFVWFSNKLFPVFNCFLFPNCRKPSLKSRPLPPRRPRLLGADPLQQQSVFLTSFPTFFIIVWTNPDKILENCQFGWKTFDIKWRGDPLSLLPTIIALQVGNTPPIQNNNLYPWWERGPCFATEIPVFVMLSLLSHPWDC